MISDNEQVREGETHPDIADFIDSNNISGAYRCTIQHWSQELGEWTFVRSYRGRTPQPEEAVREAGSGRFKWSWTKADKDPVSGAREPTKELTMAFEGDYWDDIFHDAQAERQSKRIQKNKMRLEERRQENMILGPEASEKVNPLDELKKMVEIMALLNPPKKDGDSSLAGTVLQLISQNADKSAQATKDMLIALNDGKSKNDTLIFGLITSLLQNRNGGNTMDMGKEFIDMFKTIMLAKQEITPASTSVLSEVLDFGKEVFPAALEFLGKLPAPMRPAVARAAVETHPKGKKGAELFAWLKENPEALAEAVEEWDKTYGPKQVDTLLSTGSLRRPPSKMENYEKYAKVENEAPDTAGATDAETVKVEDPSTETVEA